MKYKSVMLTVFLTYAVIAIFNYMNQGLFYTNNTESADQGIYIQVPSPVFQKGDMVIASLPRSYGKMKEGTSLLKKVRGLPGDEFSVNENALIIDGVSYPLVKDPRIPKLPAGMYHVPDTHYLLLNDVEDSFDGRYFGTIDKKHVHKKVVMFLNKKTVHETCKKFQQFDGTVWMKTKLKG